MVDIKINWSVNEFQAYILLYCSKSNFFGKEQELAIIKEFVNDKQLFNLKREFNKDSQYIRIGKIIKAAELLELSSAERNQLLEKVKSLFLVDGHYDIFEKKLMKELNKLLVKPSMIL